MGKMLDFFTTFILDKLLGGFIIFLKKDLIISPNNKWINPKEDKGWRISYLVFIRNKSDRPYYKLHFKVLAKVNGLSTENLFIKRQSNNGKHKPIYPVSFGPQKAFKIDFGDMRFLGKTKEGYIAMKQIIHHINPKETFTFEIIFNNLSNVKPFRVKHTLKYSKKSEEIITKEG